MSNFYAQLITCSYTPSVLNKIFDTYLKCYLSATPVSSTAPRPNNSQELVFLHLPYHPLDPPSMEIQALFCEHLLKENPCNPYTSIQLYRLSNGRGHNLGVHQMIVAYHHPPNLGNLLAPCHIDCLPGLSTLAFQANVMTVDGPAAAAAAAAPTNVYYVLGFNPGIPLHECM